MPPKSLAELFDDYATCNRSLRAESSKREYRSVINAWRRLLDREPTVSDLNRRSVAEYLADVQQRTSAANADKHARHIRPLWQFALEEELTREIMPRKSRMIARSDQPLPECYSIEQFELILEACRGRRGLIVSAGDEITESKTEQLPLFDLQWQIAWSDWWSSLCLALFDTGWRIRDLLLRRTSDLDAGGILRLKLSQKDREGSLVKLHADTLAAIDATRPGSRDMLWPAPYSTARGAKWHTARFRKILAAADQLGGRRDPAVTVPHVAADVDKPFHRIRKTKGTYLSAVRGDEVAARALGHSSVQTFRRHYLDRSKLEVETADDLPRPAVPPRLRIEAAG